MFKLRLFHLLFTSVASAAAFSMCCVLNVTSLVDLDLSAANLDTCLPNGMCQPPSSTGGFTRDLCTDPTWKSPNCVNVSVGGSDGGSSSDTSFLTQCSDGSYCCGQKTTACCNDKQGFQITNETPPYASAVSSSAGTSPSSSASLASTSPSSTSKGSGSSETGTSSPQTSQTSTNTPTQATSTKGAEIGLGAALGVILVAVVAVGIFLWMKKRRAHCEGIELASDSKPSYSMSPAQQQGNGYEQYKAYQAPLPQAPIQQSGGLHEITSASGYGPGGTYAAEMDGNGGRDGPV